MSAFKEDDIRGKGIWLIIRDIRRREISPISEAEKEKLGELPTAAEMAGRKPTADTLAQPYCPARFLVILTNRTTRGRPICSGNVHVEQTRSRS